MPKMGTERVRLIGGGQARQAAFASNRPNRRAAMGSVPLARPPAGRYAGRAGGTLAPGQTQESPRRRIVAGTSRRRQAPIKRGVKRKTLFEDTKLLPIDGTPSQRALLFRPRTVIQNDGMHQLGR